MTFRQINTAAADAAFAALAKARAEHPRLQAEAAERALFGTVARAVQPANVAQRHCYDGDYGGFNAHPADPRSDDADDDRMTEDDARAEAAEQILSYAESVADWLAKACDCDAGRQPLDVRPLEPVQIIEGSPALLLTVLMNGDNTQALRALHRLRKLVADGFAPEINSRAAQLLAEVL